VAVFVKDEQYVHAYPKRIKDSITNYTNGLSCEQSAEWVTGEDWKLSARRDFTNFSETQEDQQGGSMVRAARRTLARMRKRLTR
jgi:hypothetical protein